ncbi:alpha/beta hydrolase [Spiractinospora alimapuensis]|uniref:alpha/beta hydrolase n=1 Tax=Spiractinospora alimapuensis TaxID=2820884 RepID=UPI001F1767FA|nr:alpha/beta fold hydrolase [Spiractinospora alimapuensis]QVQ50805.1 alpha/beta hydrolase [Spiractinospora alimapuensis]
MGRSRPVWRRVGRLVAIMLGVALVLTAVLWGIQRQFIYFPDSRSVPAAGDVIDGAQDVTLRTADGLDLGAWFVPPTGPDREVAVLLANGNAGDRESRAATATALADVGFSVLLFDYRGYGGNPGKPSEEGLVADAEAALGALTGEYGFPHDRVLYFGESIGTGVVSGLATDHPPAGILLRSPFTDLPSAGAAHYPFLPLGLLLRDRYPIEDQIRALEVPTTVVYGDADSVILPEESRRVAAAVPNLVEEVVFEGTDHNDPEMFHSPRLVEAVEHLATTAVGDTR